MSVIDKILAFSHIGALIRTDRTSSPLTKYIHAALDAGVEPVIESAFHCRIAGMRLWTSNYPYNYGCIGYPSDANGIPSRYAVYRLKRAVEQAMVSQSIGKVRP